MLWLSWARCSVMTSIRNPRRVLAYAVGWRLSSFKSLLTISLWINILFLCKMTHLRSVSIYLFDVSWFSVDILIKIYLLNAPVLLVPENVRFKFFESNSGLNFNRQKKLKVFFNFKTFIQFSDNALIKWWKNIFKINGPRGRHPGLNG